MTFLWYLVSSWLYQDETNYLLIDRSFCVLVVGAQKKLAESESISISLKKMMFTNVL